MTTTLVIKLQNCVRNGKQKCSCLCNRVIATPLVLYLGLFSVAWMFSLPLHSGHTSSPLKKEMAVPETSDVKQQEHLDAVRIERDGDINKNFRKEVLLGEDEEEESNKDPKAVLEDVFKK